MANALPLIPSIGAHAATGSSIIARAFYRPKAGLIPGGAKAIVRFIAQGSGGVRHLAHRVNRVNLNRTTKMDKETAVRINGLIVKIVARANEVLSVAETSCDTETRARVERALALAVTELDLEILEPIYKEHPELRPLGM